MCLSGGKNPPARKVNMFETLKHLLSGQNQLASGGLLLMIVGGLGVYLRAVPEMLWERFVEQTTMMITVKDDDAAFEWLKEWFLEQRFLKRIRRVDLDTTVRGEKIALLPAPGTHWFWHGGRPFQVYFYRSEDGKERWGRRSQSITLRTIGRRQRFLQNFVESICESHKRRMGETSRLFIYDDGWSRVEAYIPRMLDSVILQADEKERICKDIMRFRSSRQRYRLLGVPYHRGYLLYGPPGTGKTSLVSALAADFDMCIYAVNLMHFNDRTLAKVINDVPANSIILFEDIDCMEGGKARKNAPKAITTEVAESSEKESRTPPQGVTLSGLLNVLDGFSTPDGVLFLMTSNHVETLDPALLRPGRIDYRLYMGIATDEQKAELFLRFFPDASVMEALEFVSSHVRALTMAEFQGLLLAREVGHACRQLVRAG
jgi:chaperone BCS1